MTMGESFHTMMTRVAPKDLNTPSRSQLYSSDSYTPYGYILHPSLLSHDTLDIPSKNT